MRAAVCLAAIVASAVAVSSGFAQTIPTATGQSFTLSDAAWKLFIPSTYYQRPGNVADVIVHFHGDPQTYWNNAKYANLNALIVTVNYSGLSSAYSTPFSNVSLFQTLLDQALTKAREQASIPDSLQWDKIAVSSFSAGYGAVREILKSSTYRNSINSLLTADSLYATTAGDGTPLDSQMADYKTFAGLAKNGTKTFLFSHSQVPTYTYESTAECGDELMQYLGITSTPLNTNGLGTLNFYRYAQTGNFRLWGALGTDGDSHLEHLRYIGDFLEELPLAKLVPGDFNNSGKVDASDYVLWRKKLGTGILPNDGGISPGVTDALDYSYWRSRYGATATSATGSGNLLAGAFAVPEPSTWLMILIALICALRRSAKG
jgi:PEP-CTERM motif-containing protein